MEITSPRTMVGRYRDVGTGQLRGALDSARSQYSSRPFFILSTFIGLVTVILVVFLSLFFSLRKHHHHDTITETIIIVDPPALLGDNAPVVTFSLNGDFSSIDPVAFSVTLVQHMAIALGINASQILITSLRAGSIIADALFMGNDGAQNALDFLVQAADTESALYAQNGSIFAEYLITESRQTQLNIVPTNTTCSSLLCSSPEALIPRNVTEPADSSTGSEGPIDAPPEDNGGEIVVPPFDPANCSYAGVGFRSTCDKYTRVAGQGLCTVFDTPLITRPDVIPNLIYDMRAENALLADIELSAEIASVENLVQDTGLDPFINYATVQGVDPRFPSGPNIVPNALNGLPVMRFDGFKALFVQPEIMSSAFTICITGQNFSPGTDDGTLTPLFGGNQMLGIYKDKKGVSRFGAASTPLNTPTPSSLVLHNDSRPLVFCTWSGGFAPPADTLYGGEPSGSGFTRFQMGMSLNGEESTLPTELAEFSGSPVETNIGYHSYAPDILFQGDIQQILIFNRTLSVPERFAVEDYLGTRVGYGSFSNRRPIDAPNDLKLWTGKPVLLLPPTGPYNNIYDANPVYDSSTQMYYLFYTSMAELGQEGYTTIAMRYGPNITTLSDAITVLSSTPGTWDSGYVSAPDVFYDAATSKWYMFYVGCTSRYGPNYQSACQHIGYASSTDIRGPYAKADGFISVFTNANDTYGFYGNEVVVGDPHIQREANGQYTMYYSWTVSGSYYAYHTDNATAPSITGPWTVSPVALKVISGDGEEAPARYGVDTNFIDMYAVKMTPSNHDPLTKVALGVTDGPFGSTVVYTVSPSGISRNYMVIMHDGFFAPVKARMVPHTNNTIFVYEDASSAFFWAEVDPIATPRCV